jgi:hypothetical protein
MRNARRYRHPPTERSARGRCGRFRGLGRSGTEKALKPDGVRFARSAKLNTSSVLSRYDCREKANQGAKLRRRSGCTAWRSTDSRQPKRRSRLKCLFRSTAPQTPVTTLTGCRFCQKLRPVQAFSHAWKSARRNFDRFGALGIFSRYSESGTKRGLARHGLSICRGTRAFC